MILRTGSELIVYLFLAIGIVITKQINSFRRYSKYEMTEQLAQQKEAIFNLW